MKTRTRFLKRPGGHARGVTDPRIRWGIAGVLAFEAIVAAYTLGRGALEFSLMYAAGALVLALALVLGPRRWHYAALAAASLYRAYLQTAGGAAPGVYPTYLVPLGFALLALDPKPAAPGRLALAGIVLVALARSWFVAWYFGNPTLVAANVLGAVGAWLWAAGAWRASTEAAPADEAEASKT